MVALIEEDADPGADDTEGFGRDVQRLAVYFYVDNRLLAFTWASLLQR